MNNKIWNTRFAVLTGIVFAGALMRLIPHWPNFTPIAAMALFGGAYFGRKYLAFAIPLIAMLLSDLVIGFHEGMMAVYIAFAITVSIGLLLRKRINPATVAGASLTSSVLFFLITNFAAWLTSPQLYPATFEGLMSAYTAGLVFFNDGSYGFSFFMNEVLGGLFYNTLFFGAFYLAKSRIPTLARS
ncbi:MAG: DUF6580 family putative transport protein [Bacteroidales bacterium]|jgi:hypothetical protein|nr:DUF6580 family putative transport protein [Bacteroidales bacterium]